MGRRVLALFAAVGIAAPVQAQALPSHGELHALLLQADLVVVGAVALGLCRDGCTGQVEVESVLRGEDARPGERLSFTSGAPRAPEYGKVRRQLVFLSRDLAHAGKWRLLLTGRQELGLSPAHEARLLAVKVPRARVDAERAPFASRLEALRRYDRNWGPEATPVVAAAREVFSALDFRGLTEAQLRALLGSPEREDEVLERRVLRYTFHDGEQGVMPQFWLDGPTITAVVVQGSR